MRLMRKALAVFLIASLGLFSISASAADLPAAISKAANEAAAAQARPNAKGNNDDNPYFWPGVALMSAGGLVFLYGVTHDTGVECAFTVVAANCGTTKSKATIFTGLGMAGVGAFLFYKGRSTSRPDIYAGPHVFGVRQHLTW
jgi:hypothetical protein